MSKFVLAREGKKGLSTLPGNPVAIVRSQDPQLDQLFLCTVETIRDYSRGHKDALMANVGKKDKDKDDPLGSAGTGAGMKRRRPDMDADPGEALSKQTHAEAAAEEYEYDSAIPLTLKAKEELRKQRLLELQRKYRAKGGRMSKKSRRPVGDHGVPNSEGGEDPGESSASEDETAQASDKADFIRLPLGSFFEPLPPVDDKRLTEYAAGKAGSGKSMYSAGIIRRWTKLHPGLPVFGVCKTKLKNDDAYKNLPIKQLPLSFFSGAAGGDGKAFDLEKAFGTQGCLILFDDWDSCSKADMMNVQGAISDVLNLGRKMKISCIVTSHLLTNYNQTRGIIHEANFVTVFPQHELPQAVYYLCQKLGVPKDVIGRLRKKGRWVTIHNSSPCFVLSETEAEMIEG